MPTNKLTDARCRSAKAGAGPIKLFDGGGLYLWVSPKGGKTWRLAYRWRGIPKTLSFGPYPQVSLAEARRKRDESKAALASGLDPAVPKKPRSVTFSAAAAQYWRGRMDVTASYREHAMRGLALHLMPALGDRMLSEITKDDLLRELHRLDSAGRHVYVRKIRLWASQVFEWAIDHGYAAHNPAAVIRPSRAFGKSQVRHMPALELRQVPELVQRLSMEGTLNSALACWMLAYTWTRTGELRFMEWSDIDEGSALWIIPEGKMKRRRDHLVPLSAQALSILRTMRERSRGSRYVFAAEHRLDRPISENAILYLLHRIGYKGRMTGHGWRAVASTWANERGYNADAIERQLAHVPANEVRAAYNRALYLDARRRMLQEWADWLDSFRGD